MDVDTHCLYCEKPFTYTKRGRSRVVCFSDGCIKRHRQAINDRHYRKDLAASRARHRKYSRDRFKSPEVKRKKRESEVRRKYGLEPEDVAAIIAAQDGRCAICEGGPVGVGKRLHIDHDHKTGKVRGVLCSKCNTALGLFNDDPGLLEQAVAYLLEVR